MLRGLRVRKDEAELQSLRDAGRTVDETIAEAMRFCQPGRTEAQIDERLRRALLARSPESVVAFTIIAGGPNGASPHHETGQRVVAAGDVIVLDFGTRGPGGYHSDITVTCAVGEPRDAGARAVYRTVYAAQQAALSAVRPGASCESVDQAARAVIEAAGYGEYFLHRTGHGLGLQLHEPPYLVAGNAEALEEGMVFSSSFALFQTLEMPDFPVFPMLDRGLCEARCVSGDVETRGNLTISALFVISRPGKVRNSNFSIEPGIYLPGRFGVRLEVIVAVTADGANLINVPSKPELPIVPV